MLTVSIITPTAQRNHYLPALYECIVRQRDVQWEWLVFDDSHAPNS